MRMNSVAEKPKIFTHEGAPARHITPLQQLRRSLLSCLLWENEFYEDGKTIADRITEYASLCKVDEVSALAIEARQVHGLRHAPLMLLLDLIKRGGTGVAEAIRDTIRRPDEITELVALYKMQGNKAFSAQMKRGLSMAFQKFNAYSLAKYNRDGQWKLRDVAMMVKAKAKDAEHGALLANLINKTHFPEKTGSGFAVKEAYGLDGTPKLESPDTWEVALSGGADKKETFERMLREGTLGYLALLRNLRGMMDAGVDRELVKDAILARKGADLVFPFRYVAAARACPQLEPIIDQALCEGIAAGRRLEGRTLILVDVSGSMDEKLSGKSDMKRIDAAAALASVINADRRIFTFSYQFVEVPPRFGMAGVDAIVRSQPHAGTELGQAVQAANQIPHDRLIVISDEQAAGRVPDPVAKHAYMINVASARNGVGYGRWTHIDGFSEAVIRYIAEIEASDLD